MSSKSSSGGIEEGTESDPDLLSNPYATSSSEAVNKSGSRSQEFVAKTSSTSNEQEDESDESEESEDDEEDSDDEEGEQLGAYGAVGKKGDFAEALEEDEDDDDEEEEEDEYSESEEEGEEEEMEEESEEEELDEGDDLDLDQEHDDIDAQADLEKGKVATKEAAPEDWESSSNDDTISSRSNEMSLDSDHEVHELDREAAMLFPDPPWANKKDQVRQMAVSCSLPCLLAVLIVYSTCKAFQIGCQCMFDCFTVLFKFVILLIKIVLAPLAIIWLLCMPTYIQKYVSGQFERHIGRRLRILNRIRKLLILCFLDIPYIIVACALSCVDTCVTPARDGCVSCSWNYMGRHVFDRIMEPLFKHDINRRSMKRRKFIEDSRRDHDLRAQRHRNQKKARRRKKEQAERARRMKEKKYQQKFEVKLAIPKGELGEFGEDLAELNVQMKDKKPTDRITRTMIIERRYAVAVGLFWTLAGLTMGIIILDGQKDERCEICVQNESLGVQVCRHGKGQDCSFKLHRYELFIALGVMTMGNVVMIYSVFLYKPHGGAERAAQKELEDKLAAKNARKQLSHRADDPDTASVKIVKERLREPTIPRICYRIYRHSPCHVLVVICSKCMNTPLKALYKWETKKHLKVRSTKLTERFTALVRKLDEDPEDVLEEHLAAAKAVPGDADKKGKQHGMLTRSRGSKVGLRPDRKKKQTPLTLVWDVVGKPFMWCLEKMVYHLHNTSFGRRVAGYIAMCCPGVLKAWQMHKKSKEVFMEEQGPGSRGTGPSTMEDILSKFGLDEESVDPEEEARARALAMKVETLEEKAARLRAEKPDPLGHVETLREAGKDDIPDEIELEPTLEDLMETPPEEFANEGVADAGSQGGSGSSKEKTKQPSGEDAASSQQDTSISGSAEVIGSGSSQS